MKKSTMLGAVFSAAVVMSAGSVQAETELKTVKDRISYIMGYKMGLQVSQASQNLNVDVILEAMEEGRAGSQPRLSQEEAEKAIAAFQEMQAAQSAESIKVVSDANLKEGQAFLAANKNKAGVKTTASGLQYKVITAGKGPKPTRDSTVSVHYKGTLLDGTTFDSSIDRGEPAEFGVTQVIPGWTEALLMMNEGSKWTVYLPADLAYGAGGAGKHIGPNTTLVFDVELLKANVE